MGKRRASVRTRALPLRTVRRRPAGGEGHAVIIYVYVCVFVATANSPNLAVAMGGRRASVRARADAFCTVRRRPTRGEAHAVIYICICAVCLCGLHCKNTSLVAWLVHPCGLGKHPGVHARERPRFAQYADGRLEEKAMP